MKATSNHEMRGVDIQRTALLLRNYAAVERQCVKILAGWFLAIPHYEDKYRLAYHLYDHVQHVSQIRQRLEEMRGGRPDASCSPRLLHVLHEALHAPTWEAMLQGVYGVAKRELLQTCQNHLVAADPAANAVEIKLLKPIVRDLEEHLLWYEGLALDHLQDSWRDYLQAHLAHAGGIDGQSEGARPPKQFSGQRFERPTTIIFDERIRIGKLTAYEDRQRLESKASTIEQFKVFFNEFYAAALLASVLFDGFDGNYPWEFFEDFGRHFWDEVRHSEFGAIRLQELGQKPAVCDPSLFEATEALPVLHRICYLTRGLEVFFMPRKQPRVRDYETQGDHRSQLFADQDWSDEISHVRYGTKWCDYLLQGDYRTVDDVLDEVRDHLAKVTGKPQTVISAPF